MTDFSRNGGRAGTFTVGASVTEITMHKALLISEVVANVCSELVSEHLFDCQYPGTLAAFAATCRAISEPALDALWRTQLSLVPLLRCMAPDLWEGREAEDGTIYLHLRRPIVPTDWERLLSYASRIKVLGRGTYGMAEVIPETSANVFRALSSSKPTLAGPLCPNLHTLNWSDLTDYDVNENFEYLRLFLGPSVWDLKFALTDVDFTRMSIILSLPRDYPGLTAVEICDYSDNDNELSAHSRDTISDAVCQWNQLEWFRWDRYLSHRALIHLAGLTKLQTMIVAIPDLSIADWQAHLSTLQAPGFGALRKAIIVCDQILSCASLIDITSPRQLDSIILTVRNPPEATAVGRLFQALNARCSHTTLTKFTVQNCYYPHTRPSDIIDEDMFRLLLVFPNIVEVSLNIPLAFRLGNSVLRDISISWPRLRSLHIGTRGGWAGQSQITLAGLIPLLSLPHLGQLSIAINATVVDHTLNMPPTWVSNTKVCDLHLADSIIQDEHSVAAFLSDVLPNVRRIYSWDADAAQCASVSLADARKYEARWNTVAALIATFAEVRAQERKAARKCECSVDNGA